MIKKRFCGGRCPTLSVCIVLFLSAAAVYARNFPPLAAEPKALEYGKIAGPELSWENLAEMSLWASGADPYAQAARGKPSFMDIIRGAAAELVNAGDFPQSEREQGEYVLNFMFKKLLKNYSEKQTRLDTILVNGSYNCVSSAVLYLILCKAAGLNAAAVVTRDHAFARLISPNGEIDVETTNPYGFDPGNRKNFHDGFGRVTGFAYVPARNYRDRADINAPELVSLILSNRITELESHGRYAQSLALALNREALLAFSARGNYPEFFGAPGQMVMDRIFNYGASLLKQGKEIEALQWADTAAVLRPDDERWDTFADTALNNLLGKLIRAKRFDEARNTLDANAHWSGPRVTARIASGRQMIAGAELSALAAAVKNAEDVDAALVVLKEKAPELDPELAQELGIFFALKKGQYIAAEQGWLAAIAFIDAASAEYGPDRRFEEQLRAFRSNRISELHNSFAAAYNRRDFENARAIVRAALEEFPGSGLLLQDRERLEKALR